MRFGTTARKGLTSLGKASCGRPRALRRDKSTMKRNLNGAGLGRWGTYARIQSNLLK